MQVAWRQVDWASDGRRTRESEASRDPKVGKGACQQRAQLIFRAVRAGARARRGVQRFLQFLALASDLTTSMAVHFKISQSRAAVMKLSSLSALNC